MTNEDKQLLLKDLSARLPYGVKVDYFLDLLRNEKDDVTKELLGIVPSSENVMVGYDINNYEDSVIEDFKPYLRPISSMTEEEKDEINKKFNNVGYFFTQKPPYDYGLMVQHDDIGCIIISEFAEVYDWLNARHFDYRGLIEKGLALEAPEGMYKID